MFGFKNATKYINEAKIIKHNKIFTKLNKLNAKR